MLDLKISAPEHTPPASDESVRDWLAAQLNEDRPYLLALADDGILWGRWYDGKAYLGDEDKLKLPGSPDLRGITLQQAYVFGQKEEVRLFRDEMGKWQARKLTDPDPADLIVETQVVWGDEFVKAYHDHGFTHVRERVQQGMDQVLPLIVNKGDLPGPGQERHRQVRLIVHHFVDDDEKTGERRICLSRLAGLELMEDKD